jgi:hypothetical protein
MAVPFYWERHPDGPFATIILIATTYLDPENYHLEALQRLAAREGDPEMQVFKADLRQALRDPGLLPGTSCSRPSSTPTAATRRSCGGYGATCTGTSPYPTHEWPPGALRRRVNGLPEELPERVHGRGPLGDLIPVLICLAPVHRPADEEIAHARVGHGGHQTGRRARISVEHFERLPPAATIVGLVPEPQRNLERLGEVANGDSSGCPADAAVSLDWVMTADDIAGPYAALPSANTASATWYVSKARAAPA